MKRSARKSSAKEIVRTPDAEPVVVPRAMRFDLRSAHGCDYRLFVWIPDAEPPAGGFPVLILLDGNATFATAVEAVSMQMRRPNVTGVQPLAVVAIGYPNDGLLDAARRQFDYTPAARLTSTAHGGAEAFLDFIEDDVKALLVSEFLISAGQQTLFGHSLGGLFTLYALFTRPFAFARYAAASPSIWWDQARLLDWEAGYVERTLSASDPRQLMLTVGSLEAGTTAPDGTPRRMMEDVSALKQRLASVPSLRVSSIQFDGENHASVVPAAVSRAVRLAGAAF